MEIGDRVITTSGDVGHIELIELSPSFPTADVRILTPHNKPSACVSTCRTVDLRVVSSKVIPMPRSIEWWQEATEFCAGIEWALYDNNV